MALPSSPRRAASVAGALAACSLALLAGCSSSERSVTTDAAPTTIDIAENPQGGTFRLLTYNVDGLPVEISTGHPDRNLPLISPLLNDDDLVLTQEDYDWWKPGGLASTVDFVNYHGRLRADATHEYQSPQHPGNEAVGITDRPDLQLGDGLGLLSDLPITGDERVPWKGCFGGFNQDDHGKADCLAIKGFQASVLTLANGAEVHVYNLNAEAGTSPDDVALRKADLSQLAAHIAQHAKGAAVIVGGTTNLRLDGSGEAGDPEVWSGFLKAAGLTDSCQVNGCKDGSRGDRVAYRSGDGVALEATKERVRSDRFVDADGEPLSQRPPVEVTFAWKPAP